MNERLPATSIPSVAIVPYWEDLKISPGSGEGISYEVSTGADGPQVTFEWIVTSYDYPDQYFHFTATFYEDIQGVANFSYYQTANQGGDSTIGAQNRNRNQSIQYSFDSSGAVPDQSFVVLDTRVGSGSSSSGDLSITQC